MAIHEWISDSMTVLINKKGEIIMLPGWKLVGENFDQRRKMQLLEFSAGEVKNSTSQSKGGWDSATAANPQMLVEKSGNFDLSVRRLKAVSIAVATMQEVGLNKGVTMDKFIIEWYPIADTTGNPKHSIVLRNCRILKSDPHDLRRIGGGTYREILMSVGEVEFVNH